MREPAGSGSVTFERLGFSRQAWEIARFRSKPLVPATSARCLLSLEEHSISGSRWTADRHPIRTPRARKVSSARGHPRTTRALPGSGARAGRTRRPIRRARDPCVSRVRGTRSWIFARPLRRMRERSACGLLVQTARILPVLRRAENGRYSCLARRSCTRSLPAPPPMCRCVSGYSRCLTRCGTAVPGMHG